MAWYAKVKNNAVVDVTYLVDTKDSDWLHREYGGTWLRCAEDGSIRGLFPAAGFTYDADRDIFVPPKPFASWVLNEAASQWTAPVAYPDDGSKYAWDEATTSWALAQ